jgi:molybdate transport system substrate-binding protein
MSWGATREAAPCARAPDLVVLIVLGALLAVLVWSRFSLLGVSVWRDEAYTAVHYVNRGPDEIIFGRYVPNNHVLFSLLAWLTTRTYGRGEAVYRLWSVVPAIAAVVLVAWWSWRRISRLAAVIVVLLVLVSPLHLGLAAEARGYGLGFLAGAGVLVSAMRAGEHGRSGDLAFFAVFATIGIWTLPVFSLLVVMQGLVLIALPAVRRRTSIAIAGVAVASLAFYAPLLGDILGKANQRFGDQLPWDGWLQGPSDQIVLPTLRALAPEGPAWISEQPALRVMAVVLVALAVRRCWRRAEYVLLSGLIVPVVGVYTVLVAARVYVHPRFASYLLFHVVVLMALGVTEAWTLIGRTSIGRAVAAVAVLLAVMMGVRNAIVDTQSLARAPIDNYRLVAQIADGSGIDEVVTNSPRPEGLYFYLGERRVKRLDPSQLAAVLCDRTRNFAFVDQRTADSPKTDVSCLRERGLAPINAEQRAPGSLDVWLADDAGADGAQGDGSQAMITTVAGLEPAVRGLVEAYDEASDADLEVAVSSPDQVVQAAAEGRPAIVPGAGLGATQSVAIGRSLAIIAVPAGNPAQVTGVDAFASNSGLDTQICGEDTPFGNLGAMVMRRAGVEPDGSRVAAGCEADALARVARGELDATLVFRGSVAIPTGVEVVAIPGDQNIVIDIRYGPVVDAAGDGSFQSFLASDAAKQVLSRQGLLP